MTREVSSALTRERLKLLSYTVPSLEDSNAVEEVDPASMTRQERTIWEQPELRPLEFRSRDHSHIPVGPGAHRSYLPSLLGYMRGAVAPVPCSHCANGHGPFRQCVTVKDRAGDPMFSSACASCYFGATTYRCTFYRQHVGVRARAAAAPSASRPRSSGSSSAPSGHVGPRIGGVTLPAGRNYNDRAEVALAAAMLESAAVALRARSARMSAGLDVSDLEENDEEDDDDMEDD